MVIIKKTIFGFAHFSDLRKKSARKENHFFILIYSTMSYALIQNMENCLQKMILINEENIRESFYSAMENEFGMFSFDPSQMSSLRKIYQSSFDRLVDMLKRSSGFKNRLEKLKQSSFSPAEFKSALKMTAFRAVQKVFKAHIELLQKLIKLISGSINLKAYTNMLPYQMSSLMWMDLTADSGRIENEIYPIAEVFVGQMYFLPFVGKEQSFVDNKIEDSTVKMLGYLRLACHIVAEILSYGSEKFLKFDLAQQQYFKLIYPKSMAVEMYGGRLERSIGKITGKVKKECVYGYISLDEDVKMDAA
jgi:hypothetical protein